MVLPPTNYYLRILKKNLKYIINDFILSIHIDPYSTSDLLESFILLKHILFNDVILHINSSSCCKCHMHSDIKELNSSLINKHLLVLPVSKTCAQNIQCKKTLFSLTQKSITIFLLFSFIFSLFYHFYPLTFWSFISLSLLLWVEFYEVEERIRKLSSVFNTGKAPYLATYTHCFISKIGVFSLSCQIKKQRYHNMYVMPRLIPLDDIVTQRNSHCERLT